MSKSLDQDQARHIVGSDLGSNCLQRLSADDKLVSKELTGIMTENKFYFFHKQGILL